MADEEKNENKGAEDAGEEKKSKKPLFLGGGIALLLGLAYVAATMAVPSPKEIRRYAGPFVVQLFPDKIHINLNEEGKKRFLQMNFNVVYMAYDEAYISARIADPLYSPYVHDCIRRVSMPKKIEDVMGGPARTQLYTQEIRDAIGPILFPVHIGATVKATDQDLESGIAPGLSHSKATFRPPFDEGLLKIDSAAMTVQLGEGEAVEFKGTEDDLELTDELGRTLFLDVTGLNPEFSGDVSVGIHGAVREVLVKDLLVQ